MAAVKTPAPQRAAGRKKLAKAGNALPDGSFPIPNVSYLKKAIRAVGRAGKGKRPALAKLIRKRARELGGAGLSALKGSWADSSQSATAMANALREAIELSNGDTAGMDPVAAKIYDKLTKKGMKPAQAKAFAVAAAKRAKAKAGASADGNGGDG